MHNVIVCWTKNNAFNFERNIPLLWSGRRNRQLESKNKIDVLFLGRHKTLDKKYIADLKDVGYRLFDVSEIYKRFSSKYRLLDRFGDYEKKCFLRWLVIKDFYAKSPFIHFDADIVFNETPENLTKKLGKYTFVLQGCPALVSIRNPDWLKFYEKSLNEFAKDIEKYSQRAWEKRKEWQRSFKEKWAGSRFRRLISSDQDLISHLVHTEQLPQDKPLTIKKALSDMILFENPLYFFEHNQELTPFKYQRINLIDYLNNKRVVFWHMQTNFVDYLKKVFILKSILKMPGTSHNPLEKGPKTFDQFIYHFFYTIGVVQKLKRLDIYKYFFEKKDFSLVFNNKIFWKKVFK